MGIVRFIKIFREIYQSTTHALQHGQSSVILTHDQPHDDEDAGLRDPLGQQGRVVEGDLEERREYHHDEDAEEALVLQPPPDRQVDATVVALGVIQARETIHVPITY